MKVISKKVRCAIENDFDFQPGCEKCELGKIKVDNPDGFGWKTETCGCYFESELLNQVLSATKKSNLPLSILKAYSMDDYTEERITLELLKEYVYGELMKEWLYLAGNPGTGKTYTGVMVIKLALAAGKECLYVNVTKLMDELRPNEKDTGKLWMSRCISAEVMILDDIGQEKPSEWVLERLYIIINERYMNRRFTIFTSNISLDNLHEKLKHPAIISRIKHLALEVNFAGKDKRQKT